MAANISLDNIRHSLAHLLAMAVLKKFPKAKLGIGPVIDTGFYYDFKLPAPLTEGDLAGLEATMRELIAAKLPVTGHSVTTAKAKKLFKDQPFKIDLIKEFVKEKKDLTVYTTGETTSNKKQETKRKSNIQHSAFSIQHSFTDLCRGGHVENTSDINPDAFRITSIAGAYWKGDEKNAQLTRIYGAAFATKQELDQHLRMLDEAKKRDHKKLGIELDLFTFSDLVGPGLPLWTPKGTVLRDVLDSYVWELRKAAGYERVDIPHITKKELYERSGHWDKFKDELFRITTREGHEFALKPMNCPHHIQLFARKKWSYKELPQRYASTTKQYRDEQTGELSGLARVRSITIDDAHVFCRPNQVRVEILKIWDIIHTFYGRAGFKLRVRLSLSDPKNQKKYLGTPEQWKRSEQTLRDIIKERKADAFEAPGEAAFYGPKIDFLAKDSLGREWQVATIQLDMNQPERFNLSCVGEDGAPERIVMIHAAIMGSIERYLSILIEHFAGAFPFWLAPVQVGVLPITDKVAGYAKDIMKQLADKGVRAWMDDRNETIGRKIREAEMQKIPYLLIIGPREVESKTVAVRERGKGNIGQMPLGKFVEISLHHG